MQIVNNKLVKYLINEFLNKIYEKILIEIKRY